MTNDWAVHEMSPPYISQNSDNYDIIYYVKFHILCYVLGYTDED